MTKQEMLKNLKEQLVDNNLSYKYDVISYKEAVLNLSGIIKNFDGMIYGMKKFNLISDNTYEMLAEKSDNFYIEFNKKLNNIKK